MALGSLLIQKQLGFSDRELVEEIMENPYFQYFIGLPGYQTEAPFVPSLLVELRKRLTDDVLSEINELLETECELTQKQAERLAEKGMARIEKMSFDAYNESDVLIAAAERYFERTGHYPERILADKIYRNRNNLAYCREHRIRLSGPSLGRPKKNAVTDRKTEYRDNADRIAVERAFALAKQKYGLGLITSRLDETTRSSIALSVIAINLDRISRSLLRLFFDIVFSRCKQHEFMLINIQNNNPENLVCC